ncbi:hypothetical protein OUZ56_002605 [Daphnia magna]|uniref:Uncharacterized protein n=1 Tax=Daphnia magna TaxID=35525 RepID=A0ABR0A671_9CRUS|nr:hypothetical protein OUZ56_002605 [Daphnia magna]
MKNPNENRVRACTVSADGSCVNLHSRFVRCSYAPVCPCRARIHAASTEEERKKKNEMQSSSKCRVEAKGESFLSFCLFAEQEFFVTALEQHNDHCHSAVFS